MSHAVVLVLLELLEGQQTPGGHRYGVRINPRGLFEPLDSMCEFGNLFRKTELKLSDLLSELGA